MYDEPKKLTNSSSHTKYSTTNKAKGITTFTHKPASLCGNSLNNFTSVYKTILPHSPPKANPNSTSTATSPRSSLINNKTNISSSPESRKPLPENKFKPASPTSTPIKKETKSTTFGIANTFVPKTKNKKKLPKQGVTRNSTQVTLRLTC